MITVKFQRQDQYLELYLVVDNPFRDDSLLQAKSGKVNYRFFLEELIVSTNDRTLFSAQFNPSMAAQPMLKFRVKHVLKNDVINVTWQDNLGKSGLEKFKVTV